MAISKKIRFEVFKRDGFQCAYCGKTPPEVTLEVDHIEPKSKGGKDGIENLITACFDCNRGKKDIPLDKIPNKLQDNIEILKAKEEQLREYRKFVKSIRARINKDIDLVQDEFQKYFEGYAFSDDFRISVKEFLSAMEFYQVIDAMNIACLRMDDQGQAIKYFCGICWNTIKGKQKPYV
jgi:hypothetical protein